MNLILETQSKQLNWIIGKAAYWGESELFGEVFHTWIFEGRLPHNMRRELRRFINSDPFYVRNRWIRVETETGHFEIKPYVPQDVYKACRVDITQVITRK